MTKKQKVTKKAFSVFTAFIMLLMVVITVINVELTVNAATPAYVTWRQTDQRWGSILLGSESDSTVANIGCAATSTCVLLAHSGVCSTDETIFNPKIGITALKNAGAFNSAGEISWGVVSKVYSDFKYVSRETLSGTNSDKLKQIQNYYDKGYYMIVSCNANGGTSTNHWVAVRSCQNNKCTIIDTGGKNYTDLSKYTITNRVILYTASKKSNQNDDTIKYESMPSGDILLKNKSTNTYMAVDGGTASNGQNVSVASKASSNAFKFSLSGGVSNYLASKINETYVLNPYSDTPSNNTNVTLYNKDNSGTQTWKFEAVSGGYIIHNGFDESCVLTVDGTNVKLATKTGKDNQIWILESPVPSLSSITVENAGKTDYYVGETLDTGGMKITAKYEDGSTKDITTVAEVLYDFSTSGTKNVTFSYTEENVTKTTQLAVTVKEIPTGFFSGSGTQNDPFLIQNKADLEKMRDLVNNTAFNPVYGRAYYLQTADIDLENENWIPIGLGFGEDGQYNYKTRMFYGVYNGSNHYIRNLHVDGAYENAGLFGAIRENTCEVRNIVVTGQVKTSGMNAGGIAGQQQYSALIENCAFIGDVSANEMAGGIVGYLYNGTSRENSFCVSNCYHIGSVNSNKYAGGLVGRILFNQYGGNEFYVLIENSYHAKGKVSGGTTAGAICSEIVRNDNVTCKANIVNCFAGTDCAVNIGVKDATVDTSMLKSNSDMRKLAADMGEPFADHNDSQLCDGYTVFAWQIDRSIGDINADGEVNVADVILLQKWILAIPDTHLANWKAADLYEDNQLNVFDLCLLKRKLLEK
ncbi:MAG: hypothetical protein HDT22_04915 [Ruminococcus sp.]|nr:hypothetical protein [Ruminococcus sp.]